MQVLIPNALEQAAQRDPRRMALVLRGDMLTYGDFWNEVQRTARYLIACGVKRHDRVGVSMPKSFEGVIAIFATMQAGAIYVPIDPTLPAERVAFILNDCEIKVLFAGERNRAKLVEYLEKAPAVNLCIVTSGGDHLPCASMSWEELRERDCGEQNPWPRVLEDDPAYIIYTSGSTGTPKGIMHCHRSGFTYARWVVDHYGLHAEDRLANHAPLHFDMSTFDLFAGVMAGATIVLIPEEAMMMPAAYTEVLAEERVTVLFVVPLVISQMVLRGTLAQRDLSALRWIVFGGDVTTLKHLQNLMHALPETRFNHMYGPAETNGCTSYQLERVPNDGEDLPIGMAFSNMEVIVVDDGDQEIGPGETGEILVRGPTMMLGYWGNQDLTRERIHKRESVPGVEVAYYRTGDLAKLREDGNLVFAGRKDRQIKTRGYRVEMDEVEAALLTHQDVDEAAVFLIPREDSDRGIGAAVIVNPRAEVDSESLREHAAKLLPRYAVPERIAICDALPKTTSGKIDRNQIALVAEEELGS